MSNEQKPQEIKERETKQISTESRVDQEELLPSGTFIPTIPQSSSPSIFSSNLSTTLSSSSATPAITSDPKNWEENIRRDIGPSSRKLIKKGESAAVAYHRHRNMMLSLAQQPLPQATTEYLLKRISNNRNYYWDKIITDSDFSHIFSNIAALQGFVRQHPAYEKRLIDRLLENETDFVRVINSTSALHWLTENHSTYARRFINYVLNNDAIFAFLIHSTEALDEFKSTYPNYASRAKKLFTDKPKTSQKDAKDNGLQTNTMDSSSSSYSSSSTSTFTPSVPVNEINTVSPREFIESSSGFLSASYPGPTSTPKNQFSGVEIKKEKKEREVKKNSTEAKPSAFPLSSSTISGVSSQTEQKSLTLTTNYFSQVFSVEGGPAPILYKYLSAKDLAKLASTSKENKNIVSDLIDWEENIKRDIGPNLKKLIIHGESAFAAYNRHKNIIYKLVQIPLPQKNLGGLLAIAKKHPNYHWDKMITDKDFVSVISSIAALRHLTSHHPAYAARAIEGVLSNDTVFMRLILSLDDLNAFTQRYSTHKNKAIDRFLTNKEAFSRIISSLDQLRDFIENYPAYKEKILEHLLANDADFYRMISTEFWSRDHSSKFINFAENYPNYAERVLKHTLTDETAFISVVNSTNLLHWVAKNYPTYVNKILERVSNNERHLARVINSGHALQDFTENYPYYADKAIEHVLSNEENFRQVVYHVEPLNSFIRNYPTYANRAIEYIFKSKENFERIIWSIENLHKFTDNNPSYADRAIEYVLTNEATFARITADLENLYSFTKKYPAYAKRILKRVLTNEADFTRLISWTHQLHEFTQHYPSYANKAIERVLTNDAEFIHVISDIRAVLDFSKYHPEHAERVLEQILTNETDFIRVINGISTLGIFIQHYPIYTDRVLERILTNEVAFTTIIGEEYKLREFSRLYPPAYANRALEFALTNDKAFAKIMKDNYALEYFIKFHPDYRDRALERILNNEAAFANVINYRHTLRDLIKHYPTYTDKVLERILTNEAAFASVVKDMRSLDEFIECYPTYTNRILDRVVTNGAALVSTITRAGWFLTFSESYPSYTSRALECLLKSDTTFAHFINNDFSLSWIIRADSAYTDRILENVLTNDIAFAGIIDEPSKLHSFAHNYPAYADKAIQRVLTNDADFARVIKRNISFYRKSPTDALYEFIKNHPAYASKSIERVLQNTADFDRLIQTENDLKELIELISKHFPNTEYAEDAKKRFMDKQNVSRSDAKESKSQVGHVDTSSASNLGSSSSSSSFTTTTISTSENSAASSMGFFGSMKNPAGNSNPEVALTEKKRLLTYLRAALLQQQSKIPNAKIEKDLENLDQLISQMEAQLKSLRDGSLAEASSVSSTQHSSSTTDTSLPSQTYMELDIPGDGNCLYSAVALYVGQDQQQLRNQVADELEKKSEKYKDFLELKAGQTPEQYIKGVRDGSEWAGQVEIRALMHTLQRPIIIVRPGQNAQDRVRNPDKNLGEDEYFASGEPILVKYNGHNHYDAIVLIEKQHYISKPSQSGFFANSNQTSSAPISNPIPSSQSQSSIVETKRERKGSFDREQNNLQTIGDGEEDNQIKLNK